MALGINWLEHFVFPNMSDETSHEGWDARTRHCMADEMKGEYEGVWR